MTIYELIFAILATLMLAMATSLAFGVWPLA